MTTVTQPLEEISVTVMSPEIDRIIIQYTNHLLKKGRADSTILGKVKLLKSMIKNSNIEDPESIKLFIAKQGTWCHGRKRNAVYAYHDYVELTGKEWNPPTYHRVPRPIWIPLEKEIDQLIAASSHKIGTFLQLLKETGMRPWRSLSTHLGRH